MKGSHFGDFVRSTKDLVIKTFTLLDQDIETTHDEVLALLTKNDVDKNLIKQVHDIFRGLENRIKDRG
jgi:hypothetical protein